MDLLLCPDTYVLISKSAWSSVVQPYYQYGTLNCPTGGSVYNASPILSLTPISSYYTVSQPVRVTWTASDISAISSPGATGTLACDTGVGLASAVSAASCASTDAPASSSAGTYTVSVTATGTNGNGSNQTTAQATVTVGLGPLLNTVTDIDYTSTIHAADFIVLWGNGFANEKTNMIRCSRSGYSDVVLSDSDGIGLIYESNLQINVNLASRLAPGTWTLSVWNGWSGTPSNGYQVTILQ